MGSSPDPKPTQHPMQPPSPTHEVIVVLENIMVPWVEPVNVGPGKTYETLVYRNTVHGRDDVAARVREASVVVAVSVRLDEETLRGANYLCVWTPLFLGDAQVVECE